MRQSLDRQKGEQNITGRTCGIEVWEMIRVDHTAAAAADAATAASVTEKMH